MADTLSVLRRALETYLVLVALLGVVTLAWSMANMVLLDTVTLASIWFAIAGAGTLLVAVLILRHVYVGESGVATR